MINSFTHCQVLLHLQACERQTGVVQYKYRARKHARPLQTSMKIEILYVILVCESVMVCDNNKMIYVDAGVA